MKKIITSLGVASTMLVMPFIASAATKEATTQIGSKFFNDAGGLVNQIISFINNFVIPLLFAAIFVYFAFAMFQIFVKGKGDAAAAKEGGMRALYAVIGTVLILSFYGIVNYVAGGVGFDDNTTINTPQVHITQPKK